MFMRSMNFQKLGRSDEARASYEQASKELEQLDSELSIETTKSSLWRGILYGSILQREAEATLPR